MWKNSKVVLLCAIVFSLTAKAQFSNQSELSMLITGGNTDVNLYNFKSTSKYDFGKWLIEAGGHYTLGENNGQRNAKNWDINAKASRDITEKMSGFYATKYEHIFFAGIQYRFNNDLGITYQAVKTDKTDIKFDAGYRLVEQKLIVGPVEETFSQARLYGEIKKNQSKDFFYRFWVEYLPNFTDSDDWQLNVEPSLTFTMSSILSLKVGYLYRYDNVVPTGLEKYDTQYTTTLIAQF